MQEEEALEEGAEFLVYELGFHIDPELSSEGVKKEYQTVRELITKNGVLVAEGEPQLIQLAYTISRQETSGRRDFKSAHFCWIAYEALAQEHAAILGAVGADKNIIRFIDVVTTKDAARHAAEMSEFSRKALERTADKEETVVGAELDAALENIEV